MKIQLYKIAALTAVIILLALALTRNASAAPQTTGGTFTVNTTSDVIQSDSTLSLREAIALSNGGTGPNGLNHPLTDGEKAQTNSCTFSSNAAPWQILGGCGSELTDTIHFNIPGAGVHTIKWLLSTPGETEPVILDAFSQPGSHANTLKLGDNAVRLITLDAANSYGFYLAAGYSTARGFEIIHFPAASMSKSKATTSSKATISTTPTSLAQPYISIGATLTKLAAVPPPPATSSPMPITVSASKHGLPLT